MGGDLTRPLGLGPAPRRARVSARGVLLGLAGFATLALAGYLALARDPQGGQPVAVAAIETIAPDSAAPQVAANAAQAAGAPAEPHDRMSAAELERESGVVVVRRGGAAPGSVVLRVPDDPSAVRLAPAPDPRLVEQGRHGPLPKVGADGARPSEVYARHAPANRDGRPRVAIFVGGLGIGRQATNAAIARLPGPVTLAFAPYGADLERQVAEAREAGHEVMLQLPMEPFDYPDNDPGPQTLLASAKADKNLDRLQWLLSRFPGYVGVSNYLGGKFTASAEALAPVMHALAARGLIFVDDASSMRSIAGEVAAAKGLPAAKADVVIDAVPSAVAIDAALVRLEQIARAKGTALGVASALPASVAAIGAWARALEARGIVLVPVSSLVPPPRRMG
jgi:polysaccharide deacetylase 2 family uncharacterized protein YibQ